MHDIKNSDVVKQILFSLVNVASDKSSEDYAWSVIKNLLIELKTTHVFLKYIEIDDLDNLNKNIDDIHVNPEFNNINSEDVGKSIQNIIDVFRNRMGRKAGYFFIQEFKNTIGEDYNIIIKKMGVDLRLSDLQNELSGMDAKEYKIKDDRNSNIAFIERN